MLTFRFAGARGEMIEPELLVSGMAGKQIRFEFSEEWAGLRKTAVYRAGSLCCTNEDIGEFDIIPEKVLQRALVRLYVGVRGESGDGTVVIPTVLVPGPFIHIGTAQGPDVDPEDPDWNNLLEEAVRWTPQVLTEAQKSQVRANIGAASGGLGDAVGALLLELLRKAVFTEDVSSVIGELEAAMQSPEVPQEPENLYYSVSCGLEHTTAEPASMVVEKGQGCTVTLTAETGYVLDTVRVTMGGADITASVYAGGKVTIGAVTGHVVITARAVVREEQTGGIFFVAATVSEGMINAYALPSNRISMVTEEAVADTPFPQNGHVHDGEVYLIPVPAGTNVLTVESPGLIGGPQFFNLENGVYTCALDAGWRTEDGFTYEFEADRYGFVAINFKNRENSNFYTADYDTSGITAEFSWAEPEQEDTEVPVTLSLTRTSVTNNQRTVQLGASYNTMFVPADGCFLDKVTVTMDGTDVTAEVYKDGKIAIAVVTGAILVLAVSAEEPGPVEIQDIMMGSTSFVEDAGLQIHRVDTMTHRATLVPVGQYLKKGSTYRFSLGGAEGFSYGVQIMVASSAGLVFDSTEGIEVYHNTVVSREVDTGWMSTDYTYTPAEHNRIFTMNFKYGDAAMDESHYQQLLENVVVEEVTV